MTTRENALQNKMNERHQQYIDMITKSLINHNHECVEYISNQLQWCGCETECLVTTTEKIKNSGNHPCAYYYNKQIYECCETPCKKLEYDQIKKKHPCAIYNSHSFEILICGKNNCIIYQIDEIKKTHPCATISQCEIKCCNCNPCLEYLRQQMIFNGHDCAGIDFEKSQIYWCEEYEKCTGCATMKLYNNKYYALYKNKKTLCDCC